MIIVVDGYNLLKYQYPRRSINDKERYVFLHKIAQYGRKKRHKIVVVFDGGLYDWSYKEKIAGVMVIYSGSRESADEVIMQYLEDHKNKDVLLVSSDHELNLFASQLHIVSIGAEEFTYLLTEALNELPDTVGEIDIHFDEEETDFDRIMEQAVHEIQYKEDDKPRKEKVLVRTRSSKKDKALLKKLKKL